MYTTRLKKVGGSIMLAVPPAVLKTLELSTDSEVGMTINNGCLIIEPQKRPHYSLEELLAQCDPHAEMSEEERNGSMRLRWARRSCKWTEGNLACFTGSDCWPRAKWETSGSYRIDGIV
jgi:antitoxin ChpS